MSANLHGARRLQPVPADQLVSFTFDGAPVSGRKGEPVVVALLAAGVQVFRTMPYSGEPRGGFCFTGRCSDCLMIVDGISGVRACTTGVRAGMDVQTQHGHGVAIPGVEK